MCSPPRWPLMTGTGLIPSKMVIVVKAGALRDKTLPLFDCSDEARDALVPAGRLPSYIKDHRARLRLRVVKRDREAEIIRYLEREVWPTVPERALGRRLTKREEDRILGYGPSGA